MAGMPNTCPICREVLDASTSATGTDGRCSRCAGAFTRTQGTPVGKGGTEGTLTQDSQVLGRVGAAGAGDLRDSDRRYHILRPHAQGGLGEVFLARDEELGREVALKQIQETFADRADCRARFVKEAEITGRLEHPGIVPIYGLLHDEQGRPCYAMRFIEGRSFREAILEFHGEVGTENNTDLEFRQLLGRFQVACNTIAYAHSRGVLHRDIKPGNIMLGPFGETLVIDWGLAKDYRSDGSSSTGPSAIPKGEESTDVDTVAPPAQEAESGDALTRTGAVLGTPGYMSPEQAEGRLDDLSPASDIWSLGATLYFLLTAESPLAARSKSGGGGNKLSLEEVIPPRKRHAWVPPALEAVCLKAMAVRPEDRYPSAADLAGDIERWLADEPVSAYREPHALRWRRWRRRHRTLVTSLSLLGVTLLIAFAVGGWLLSLEQSRTRLEKEDKLRAEEEKLTAEKKLLLEQKRVTEEQSRTIREQEARLRAQHRAEKVSEYLFAVLRSPDPTGGGTAQELPIGKVLDAALRKVDRDFADDPPMRGEILLQLARTYQGLGAPRTAVAIYRRAHALLVEAPGDVNERPNALTNELAAALLHADRPGEVVALLQPLVEEGETSTEAGRTAQALLGTAYQAEGRLAQAATLLEKAHQECSKVLGRDHPATASVLSRLASVRLEAGDLKAARTDAELAAAFLLASKGRDDPLTLEADFQVARVLSKLDPDQGIPRLEDNLTLRQRALGPNHRDTMRTLASLAVSYLERGRAVAAVPFLEKQWKFLRATLGSEDPATSAALNLLTEGYLHAGFADRALPLVRTYLSGKEKSPAETVLEPAFQARLGRLLRHLGRLVEAIPELEKARTLARKTWPREEAARLRSDLIEAYQESGAYRKAATLLDEILADARSTPSGNRVGTDLLGQVAEAYLKAGEFPVAEARSREWLDRLGPERSDTVEAYRAKSILGAALAGSKKYAEAERLLLAADQGLTLHEGKGGATPHADNLRRLVDLYEAQGNEAAAGKWRKELGGGLAERARLILSELKTGDPIGYGFMGRGTYKAFEMRFEQGKQYLVEASGSFNTNLVIEDGGKKLLFTDQYRDRADRRSSTLFHPPVGGTYRVVVANRMGRTGTFFLRVQELGPGRTILDVSGSLAGKTASKTARPQLDNSLKLDPAFLYVSAMTANSWEYEQTLLDPSRRRTLAHRNCFTPVGSNRQAAELIFRPPASGEYPLIVTHRSDHATGPFRLRVVAYPERTEDADFLFSLGRGYLHAGRLEEAARRLERCLSIRKNRFGPGNPSTLEAGSWLAHAYVALERADLALPILREVQKHRTQGSNAAQSLLAEINLASVCWATGHHEEAIAHFERAAKLPADDLPQDVPFFLCPKDPNLPYPAAEIAEQARVRAVALLQKLGQPFGDHSATWTMGFTENLILFDQGNHPRLAFMQARLADKWGRYHSYYLNLSQLGRYAYLRMGNHKKTAEFLDMVGILQTAMRGEASLPALEARAEHCWATLMTKNHPQAARDGARLLEACRTHHPDHWLHSWVKCLYGGGLAGTGKFTEAEPLVLEGYQEIRDVADQLPPSRRDLPDLALDQVVFLYERWGRFDLAEEWRRKKAN